MSDVRERIQKLIEQHDVDSYRASVGAEGGEYPSAGHTTDRIIALVRADERKRIRDKLLDPVMFNEEFIGQLAVILDFIGLTEESTHGLE